MKKTITLIISILLVLTLAASCSNNEEVKNPFDKEKKYTLKVLYYDQNAFYQQYGNLFNAQYPNIDFEVISTADSFGPDKDYMKEMLKLIDKEKPDVIMGFDAIYRKLVEEGKLLSIDDFISRDKYDLEGMHPFVIESLKSMGDGSLFGLSPTFSNSALYYNKDLFDQYQIPYPTDNMSYKEILELAQRFPTTGDDETRIYGLFSKNGATQLLSELGRSEGLIEMDYETLTYNFEQPEWKTVWETATQAVKSGSLSVGAAPNFDVANFNYADQLKSNLFLSGRAAMMIDMVYFENEITSAKQMLKDFKPVENWDVATPPVMSDDRNKTAYMYVGDILGIHAESTNTSAAWEFLKFVNGETMAKSLTKTYNKLVSRTEFIDKSNNKHMEAFYVLDGYVQPNDDTSRLSSLGSEYYQLFYNKMDEAMNNVVKNNKSLDEVLPALVTQLNDEIQQAMTKAESTKEPEDNSATE